MRIFNGIFKWLECNNTYHALSERETAFIIDVTPFKYNRYTYKVDQVELPVSFVTFSIEKKIGVG